MAYRQVVYASSATIVFNEESLNALLEKARKLNSRNNITGVLIHMEGSFIQLLEGKEPALSTTYARIAADPRHTGITKLSDRTADERKYPETLMGFRALAETELAEYPELFQSENGRWIINPDSDMDSRLRVIFDTFFRINANSRY